MWQVNTAGILWQEGKSGLSQVQSLNLMLSNPLFLTMLNSLLDLHGEATWNKTEFLRMSCDIILILYIALCLSLNVTSNRQCYQDT